MIYLLSKAFWSLLQPLNLVVLILLLGLALLVLGRRRLGRLALNAGAILLVTITLLPVGQLLLLPLENRFPRPAPGLQDVDGIIVLGGAIDGDVSLARGPVNFLRPASRFTEALRLLRLYPNAKLIFTGGSSDVFGPGNAEAVFARQFFVEQGVPQDRVLYEENSRNTWENAVNTKALVNPKPGQRWLLVTSAHHMPRSVGIFRRVGWEVIPDPVDYRTMDHVSVRGFRLLFRLDELDVSLREWVGLVAYRLLDRTDTLFPGPR